MEDEEVAKKSSSMKMHLWVWKFDDGRIDIETLRDNKWDCQRYVAICYAQNDRESDEQILKRIGGKAQRVRLQEF